MKFFAMFQMIGAKILKALSWMFGMAKSTTGLSPQTYFILQIVVVLLIAAVLAFFSESLIPAANVGSGYRFVNQYYVGIVFFLCYLFARLIVYVIGLFRVEETSGYPDIDEAWAAGMEALDQADLDPQWLPVFLVVGLTPKQERNFFAGARFNWGVQAPGSEQRSAPVRFYGYEDALFVTCSGVSAAACHLESAAGGRVAAVSQAEEDGQGDGDVTRTIKRDQIHKMMEQPAAVGAVAGGSSEPMQTLMPGAAGSLAGPIFRNQEQRKKSVRSSEPALSAEQLATCRRRLEYLCGLMTELRSPWCPINGMLLAAPLDRSDVQPLKQDVQVVRESLEMLFPVVCTFPGLENLHGFTEFTERGGKLDARFRDSRAGSRFPLGHPVDEASSKWLIEKAFEWYRGWIYSAFAEDIANEENKKLYRLLGDFEERRDHFVFLLKEILGETKGAEPLRLAGCYFCATGTDAKRQAFIHGVLHRLIKEQDKVAWTQPRIDRDQRHRHWAYMIAAAAVAVLAADVFLLWKLWG